MSLLHLVDFLLGVVLWFARMFKRKGEKEREKLGGQKDMSEMRIATDLYYYYGRNRFAE